MEKFCGDDLIAVIDTETNWDNELMSIGAVIADAETYRPIDTVYFIISPEYQIGGMFSDALFFTNEKLNTVCSRKNAAAQLKNLLVSFNVRDILAYNACFDRGMLPELSDYNWLDIMKIAAYKQFNPMIPDYIPLCRTGKMKHSYGVESMMKIVSGLYDYREKHNALTDALDELTIMDYLGQSINIYREFGSVW